MPGERRALLVATDAYSDPGLTQLRAPTGDVSALAKVLADRSIGDFDVRALLNRPTGEITQEIEGFFDDARLDDLLLLYVSGHGVLSQTRGLYFASASTQLRRLRATAIEDRFVSDVMEHSRARSIVLILDCCHSGAFAKGLAPKSSLSVDVEQRFEGRGHVTLTASTELEYAFEEADVEPSVSDLGASAPGSLFTRCLVEGLKTGAADADKDGRVSVDELYDYVYSGVRERSRHQTPGKSGAGHGDIVIARSRYRTALSAEVRAAIDQALSHPWAAVRETAVAELTRLRDGADPAHVPAIEDALRGALDDDSRRVIAAAEVALGLAPGRAGSAPRAERPVVNRDPLAEAHVSIPPGAPSETDSGARGGDDQPPPAERPVAEPLRATNAAGEAPERTPSDLPDTQSPDPPPTLPPSPSPGITGASQNRLGDTALEHPQQAGPADAASAPATKHAEPSRSPDAASSEAHDATLGKPTLGAESPLVPPLGAARAVGSSGRSPTGGVRAALVVLGLAGLMLVVAPFLKWSVLLDWHYDDVALDFEHVEYTAAWLTLPVSALLSVGLAIAGSWRPDAVRRQWPWLVLAALAGATLGQAELTLRIDSPIGAWTASIAAIAVAAAAGRCAILFTPARLAGSHSLVGDALIAAGGALIALALLLGRFGALAPRDPDARGLAILGVGVAAVVAVALQRVDVIRPASRVPALVASAGGGSALVLYGVVIGNGQGNSLGVVGGALLVAGGCVAFSARTPALASQPR